MATTIFKKQVCKLAERLAEDAQRQSQWRKRMNAHNLNQSGKVIPDKPLEQGDKVYFINHLLNKKFSSEAEKPST
jgi:hypothetical protein